MRKFIRSFGYAFQGIGKALGERNMRVHVLAMIVVTLAGFFFHVSRIEWAILVVCFGMVMATEVCNTAIECFCTTLVKMNKDLYPYMGAPKDLAAGAVLITAMSSAVVGALIFLPRVLALL